MKLYSIWWGEEIPLMCSCNDCTKKKREKCLPSVHLNPLKEDKALKARFSVFCSSPTPRHSSDSSVLTQIPTGSLALTLEMSNCFDTLRPAVSRPFDSWRMFVILPKDAFGKEDWGLMFEGSIRSLWNMRQMLQAALVFCSRCNTFHRLCVFGKG